MPWSATSATCDAFPNAFRNSCERYEGIGPGWHMNKRHWISVRFDSDVPESLLRELVAQSYELAKMHLTKKQQAELVEENS